MNIKLSTCELHCPRPTALVTFRRGGLTLVELLVVLAVVTVIAGISLPTVKNSLREQRVKRAASQLQAFIEDARARAIASGGGGGVIIQRSGTASLVERCQSTRLRLAKSPPDYTGDEGFSRAIMLVRSPSAQVVSQQISLWFDSSAVQMRRSAEDIFNGIAPTLINIGDTIFVGEAGLPMRITRIEVGSDALANFYDPSSSPAKFPDNLSAAQLTTWTVATVQRVEPRTDMRRFHRQPIPFRVARTPRPAIAMPADLPNGTAIDLSASGIGRWGNQFSPMEIAVSAVAPNQNGNYVRPNADDNATDPLNPFAPENDAFPGRYDYESIWIMFGPRGNVSTVYVALPTITASGVEPVLTPVDVTGDIYLLVGRAGQVKVQPSEQLEDNDPNPFSDEARDGTTPLFDAESVWVSIKSRSGEATASQWTQPVVPAAAAPNTDAAQRLRVQSVIGRSRELAIQSQDGGSL